MSDWKNSKEMDDNELENVSGGGSGDKTVPKLYRCTVCGSTVTQYIVEGTDAPHTIRCLTCQLNRRGDRFMLPVD